MHPRIPSLPFIVTHRLAAYLPAASVVMVTLGAAAGTLSGEVAEYAGLLTADAVGEGE